MGGRYLIYRKFINKTKTKTFEKPTTTNANKKITKNDVPLYENINKHEKKKKTPHYYIMIIIILYINLKNKLL